MYARTLAPSSVPATLDLSPYSIIQEISKQVVDPTQKSATVKMIRYHFNTSAGSPLSPFSVMLRDEDLEVRFPWTLIIHPPWRLTKLPLRLCRTSITRRRSCPRVRLGTR